MKLPRLFRRETKASAAGVAMVLTPGQPAWSGRNYAAFAEEGYRKNVVAFQAINKLADAMATVRWTAWNGETEIVTHPALDVLQQPNPAQSGAQYIKAKVGFLMIAGNGYEEYVTAGGKPLEMYQLRPDRMKVIPGTDGFPKGYRYEYNSRKIDWPTDIVAGRLVSPVRHMKSFNPLDDWYGLSPIEAGAYGIDQHNEASAWMQALLQNSAQPSGALVTKDGASLTDEQFNRLKSELEQKHQGAKNAGRPMLLEGGLDWKQMGLSPKDMTVLEVKYSAARDVALAMGCPPQLLGIPGDNTYSNFQEARLSFWEDTVIPLAEVFADDWSEAFGVRIKPDFDHVPAIAAKKAVLWDMAGKATFLTKNEKRELVGYEPVEGGDEFEAPPVVNEPGFTKADLAALAYGD